MRTLLIAGAAALGALSAPAAAQPYGPPPPSAAEASAAEAPGAVAVSIAPVFADKARRISIGQRDLQELQRDLGSSVERALARRRGPGAPVRVDLVLRDAVPNRPTFEQQGRNTSLSFRSIGLGGASVGGFVTFADGRRAPVDFQWYETDLRNELSFTTWGDADRAFDILAGRLQKGDLRPYRVGSSSRDAGDFGNYYRR